MEYFAGLFDAEGCIGLLNNGAFNISLEMANEEIPNLFKERFGGAIYTRKRKERKQTWTWKINSIASISLNFLNSILPYSIVKKSQLRDLKDYLNNSRTDRAKLRQHYSKYIRIAKCPYRSSIKDIRRRIPQEYTESFAKWLAGFIDGDGNFVCNTYIDKRNGRRYFGRQLSVASIYLDALVYINERVQGSFTESPRTKNPIFKWVPNRPHDIYLCESLVPFLRLKKRQAELYQVYGWSEDDSQRYKIIDQIKHLNSL